MVQNAVSKPSAKKFKKTKRTTLPQTEHYEAEILSGLQDIARKELKHYPNLKIVKEFDSDLNFSYTGNPELLKKLRAVVAVYRVLHFDIPRPKALLGDEHFRRLLKTVEDIRRSESFQSFRLNAAGRESSVLQRFAETLAKATRLQHDAEKGEMVLRLRPASKGWDILIRLTAKPLSARDWRVCNKAGGLNACVAVGMLELAGIYPDDRVFNPMCGSGTLMIERRVYGKTHKIIGCDIDTKALECATKNIRTSGFSNFELFQADATRLAFPNNSFNVILADVPWGDAVGTHQSNQELYPAFFGEMARVASSDARFVILTHAIKQFERLINKQRDWRIQTMLQVYHGGHYPKMYLLSR